MTVEERLAKLERKNRLLQVALALILVVGGGGLLVGQAEREAIPDVVEARAFHVVGPDGSILVKMEDAHRWGGFGTITTLLSTGKELVQIGLTEGGGSVHVSNFKGQRVVFLGAAKDVGAVVTLNGDGQPLVVLTGGRSRGETGGLISTMNGKGQSLVAIGSAEGGAGTVTTMDGKGHDLVTLTASTDDTGMVIVLDPTGRERRGVLTTRP